MEKRQPLQYVLGKLNSYMPKNEIRLLPNTTHTHKHTHTHTHTHREREMKEHNVMPETIKLRGKYRQTTL